MAINESYEDYLKAIYLISKHKKGGWVSNSELSDFLNKKPSSISEMLHKLKNEDFINWKPRSPIRITQKGKKIAKQMMENYNLLKQFFIVVLNINDKELIERLCCGIEHHITPEVAKSLDNLLS
ncbi:MAG: metal-dependent transcriptional regulator [Promethearchaeota archaeon]